MAGQGQVQPEMSSWLMLVWYLFAGSDAAELCFGVRNAQ
jgi:hypothetical protein